MECDLKQRSFEKMLVGFSPQFYKVDRLVNCRIISIEITIYKWFITNV